MADDEQFSLCWNNFNTNLSAGFHESLIRGDLVDVTLAAEGQLVKAHRLILSVCSPYFRKMFTQMPPNQHAFIFLKDVSHSALKDLIQFMYCGEVNVKQDALPAFISTAEALQIKGLTETGESAPAPPQASQQQQSPAKDSTVPVSSGITTIPSAASSPRTKPTMQRVRVQSYKIDSDDGGGSDHEKIVQIATAGSSSSSTAAGPTSTVTGTTQVQIVQTTGQKRTIQQRASLTPLTATTQQSMKRAKLSSDPLEATEPAQIQTVQIVKQITATPTTQQTTEYVEMPIESITKSEPEYADEASEEVEAIDAEHDQDQAAALAAAEQEAADAEADDSANYVEDETYGDMSKYDESYFTEGDDAKAGGSGFGSETYGESGTAADQAAQATYTVDSSDDLLLTADALAPTSAFASSPTASDFVTHLGEDDLIMEEFLPPPYNSPLEDHFLVKCLQQDVEISTIVGQRGKLQLAIGGYTFIVNKKSNGKLYWGCSRAVPFRCRARLITDAFNYYNVTFKNLVHSHRPDERKPVRK